MDTGLKDKILSGDGSRLATAEQRLRQRGIKLPAAPEPFGIYAAAVRTGNLLLAVHGLVSQPVFRLGSGVAVLLLIPKAARLGAGLTVVWRAGVSLSHMFVLGYGWFFVDALMVMVLAVIYVLLTRRHSHWGEPESMGGVRGERLPPRRARAGRPACDDPRGRRDSLHRSAAVISPEERGRRSEVSITDLSPEPTCVSF